VGWEVVDEVEPIAPLLLNLWELLLRLLISLCYASRRGLGLSEFFMTDVRLLIYGST